MDEKNIKEAEIESFSKNNAEELRGEKIFFSQEKRRFWKKAGLFLIGFLIGFVAKTYTGPLLNVADLNVYGSSAYDLNKIEHDFMERQRQEQQAIENSGEGNFEVLEGLNEE